MLGWGLKLTAPRSPGTPKNARSFYAGGDDRGSSHRQRAGPHAEADPFRAEVPPVATPAVDLAVGAVVQVRRVQRPVAVGAAEAPLVPDALLADHLLGGVDEVAAAGAALALGRLRAGVGHGVVHRRCRALRADERRGVTEAEALRPEQLRVAGPAVDLLVGTVAGEDRIEGAVALGAVEALLVPHLQRERSKSHIFSQNYV